MHSPFVPPLLTQDACPTHHGEALLRLARTLRTMMQAGSVPQLLDSKHLGLLCRGRHSPSQGVVADAARGLGAHVAWVPPMALEVGDGPQAHEATRLLGRFYDALDCEGLPAEWVHSLRRDSGIPVYEGLGRRDHPLAQLLPHLDGDQAQAPGAPARDFSHGCIRVEQPAELAAFVLEGQPGWDAARIREAMARGESSTLRLQRPLPVLIAYGTALVKGGQAYFFEDLYGHDRVLDAALRNRPVPPLPELVRR
jgi:ornithine carbamoyltransferase